MNIAPASLGDDHVDRLAETPPRVVEVEVPARLPKARRVISVGGAARQDQVSKLRHRRVDEIVEACNKDTRSRRGQPSGRVARLGDFLRGTRPMHAQRP
tara:strand:- start:273 stop:569 length:297 start_codon:yes stop_codon:yes gene_type:complete